MHRPSGTGLVPCHYARSPCEASPSLCTGRWLVAAIEASLTGLSSCCVWGVVRRWGVKRVTSLGLHTNTLRWGGFSLFTNKALQSQRSEDHDIGRSQSPN